MFDNTFHVSIFITWLHNLEVFGSLDLEFWLQTMTFFSLCLYFVLQSQSIRLWPFSNTNSPMVVK
jgi:hypothetical protein